MHAYYHISSLAKGCALVTSYNPKSLHSYFPCNQGLLSQQDFLSSQNRLLLPLFPHQQLNKLPGCSEWMLAACCDDSHMVWHGLVCQNNITQSRMSSPRSWFLHKTANGNIKEEQRSLLCGNCGARRRAWEFPQEMKTERGETSWDKWATEGLWGAQNYYSSFRQPFRFKFTFTHAICFFCFLFFSHCVFV